MGGKKSTFPAMRFCNQSCLFNGVFIFKLEIKNENMKKNYQLKKIISTKMSLLE